MPGIQNFDLEDLVSTSESTITLYRMGSMRCGQKSPVKHDAMHRAIAAVKTELVNNRFNSSLDDRENARIRFISSLAFNLDPGTVVLGEADKKHLRQAITDLQNMHLTESVEPPVVVASQPSRSSKRSRLIN